MKSKERIVGTANAWENGELGRDAKHAVPASTELAQQVDDALGMQMISIRLPKELIDEYKTLAQFHKLGYQPLMRDALKRFATTELKKIAVRCANEKDSGETATKKRPRSQSGRVAGAQSAGDTGEAAPAAKHRLDEAA
jgi:hypothetical protein